MDQMEAVSRRLPTPERDQSRPRLFIVMLAMQMMISVPVGREQMQMISVPLAQYSDTLAFGNGAFFEFKEGTSV